jgi:hypothetical protein
MMVQAAPYPIHAFEIADAGAPYPRNAPAAAINPISTLRIEMTRNQIAMRLFP